METDENLEQQQQKDGFHNNIKNVLSKVNLVHIESRDQKFPSDAVGGPKFGWIFHVPGSCRKTQTP